LVVQEGKIVDASFVEVPRQRKNREDNEKIKNGKIPETFKENPHKLTPMPRFTTLKCWVIYWILPIVDKTYMLIVPTQVRNKKRQ